MSITGKLLILGQWGTEIWQKTEFLTVYDTEYVPAVYVPIPTDSIYYALKLPILPISDPHEWTNEIFFCPCFTTKVTT